MKSRIKQIKFHINSDDYFGTLATILDLLRQREEGILKITGKNSIILAKLRDDLMYLQNNYQINKKCEKH